MRIQLFRPASLGDMGKAIGAQWKGLSQSERFPFEQAAMDDKKRFLDGQLDFMFFSSFVLILSVLYFSFFLCRSEKSRAVEVVSATPASRGNKKARYPFADVASRPACAYLCL
jgi:hypothetical protein